MGPSGPHPCGVGSSVVLNVAWLDPDQLQIMHATESLGEAYDWVEWDREVVTPLSHHQPDRLFGYAAIAGAFNLSGGGPFALSQIAARDRSFAEASQKQMQEDIFAELGEGVPDIYQWVEQVQKDAGLRHSIRQHLAEQAVQPERPPWKISTDLKG